MDNAAAIDRGPRPPRPPRQRRRARPATPGTQLADPRLAALPTPAEIADQVRRQPIGAVLADICYDLGIVPADPLWKEIHDVSLNFGGNYARLLQDTISRAFWLE